MNPFEIGENMWKPSNCPEIAGSKIQSHEPGTQLVVLSVSFFFF